MTPWLTRGRLMASLILLVAIGWLVFAALFASTGLFVIDELIYQGMIDAFVRGQSLAVENGFGEHPSDALRLIMLVESSGRLMPQYPSGWAIVAAPAYAVLGLRGVVLLNAMAAVATLGFVWIAARAILDDRHLASATTLLYAIATFAVDYAAGIWPHAIATCFVSAAFAATAVGWRSEGSREVSAMFLAGLALGLAVNLRTDSILGLPAFALWVLATYQRPFSGLLALGIGLLPGMVAAATLNAAKFSVFSPVSYGRQGAAAGATSIDYYAPVIPVLLLIGIACLALGLARVRALIFRPSSLGLASLAAVLLVVAVPVLSLFATRILTGFYVLMVDMQAYTNTTAPGVTVMGDGTYRFWGLAKKPLLQSLPYLAGLIVLFRALASEARCRPVWLCLLFCVIWALPFAYGQWHGGLSNNMRYFGPMLPPLCILAIASLREVQGGAMNWAIVLGSACVTLIVAAVGSFQAGYPLDFTLQNVLPGGMAVVLAAMSLLLLSGHIRARCPILAANSWRGAFLACVVAATVSAYHFDLAVTQSRRLEHAANTERFADLPPNSLVFTFIPEAAGFRLNSPPSMTAQADYRYGTMDAGLVRHAQESGRRVFVQGRYLADLAVREGLADEVVGRYGIHAPSELFELRWVGHPSGR